MAMGIRDKRREDILKACDKLRAEHSVFSSTLRNLKSNPSDEDLQHRMEGRFARIIDCPDLGP